MILEQYLSNEYARASVILIGFLILIRICFYIFERVALKITSKTKTDLDDKLIAKSSIPLTLIAFLLSLRISLEQITLTEYISKIIHNLIYTGLIIVIAYLAYVIIDVVIINAIKKVSKRTKTPVDDSLISLMNSVLRISLVPLTILYILSYWGIQVGPLLAGLGIAGLAVALALQPILSNIFSGASIILDHSVSVGDLVNLTPGIKGKIQKIGLRSTRIVTLDNELIIVPNSKLADSMIQNIALPEPATRITVPFAVAYGSDIEKVKKTILKELKSVPVISKKHEPVVRFIEMADSSLKFKAYFYLDTFEESVRNDTIDIVNTKIYNSLNEQGIAIPFPQLDVHLKK